MTEATFQHRECARFQSPTVFLGPALSVCFPLREGRENVEGEGASPRALGVEESMAPAQEPFGDPDCWAPIPALAGKQREGSRHLKNWGWAEVCSPPESLPSSQPLFRAAGEEEPCTELTRPQP